MRKASSHAGFPIVIHKFDCRATQEDVARLYLRDSVAADYSDALDLGSHFECLTSIGHSRLCNHVNALCLSSKSKWRNWAWTKWLTMLGTIARKPLSVTAATLAMCWWWFLTNFKCDTKASKSDQPGKDSVCIRNPCNSPSDSMKGSITCARASKSAC